MGKVEMVEFTLKLPKNVIDFLKAFRSGENVGEYLAYIIVDHIADGLHDDTNKNPKELVKKYNLMSVFRKYDVSVPGYINPEA